MTRPQPSVEPGPSIRPRAVDLFCGYGGWTDGLLKAGFDVDGFDTDPKCEKVYPGRFHLRDVSTIVGTEFKDAKVIVASPPCQRFSEARASRTLDPPTEADLTLLRHAVRIIKEAQPEFWAIENVRGAVPLFSKVLGPPVYAKRPFYLWGHFPGFLVQNAAMKKMGWVRSPKNGKWITDRGNRDPHKRAKLPGSLTIPFAQAVA